MTDNIIAELRGTHRGAHLDEDIPVELASHLLMIQEWPIICERFIDALTYLGLNCVSKLQFTGMDQHLLTALVERWSPRTNTFHLPVGEMTITLQDVSMLLGLRIDGPALIGPNVVGQGRRWQNWADCCEDLIGCYPDPNIVYYDPTNYHIQAKFDMGKLGRTYLPLRWLRWTFMRDSYIVLSKMQFKRHLRAYILFLIGSYLLPEKLGSVVHLRYLPLLEDLKVFRTYSVGGAVLCHLYRELALATKPHSTKIAGCIHLLQLWSWERLHVGRPVLHIPQHVPLHGLSIGYRWNVRNSGQLQQSNIFNYRDELDGLLYSQVIWEPYTPEIRSQVAQICLIGEDIWLSNTMLLSWTRAEWHLPDRVRRQFGFVPACSILCVEHNFIRTDGRRNPDTDWFVFYQSYIGMWENRQSSVVQGIQLQQENAHLILSYLQWYRSWANLYMLNPPKDAPTADNQRATLERHYREFLLDSDATLQYFFGRNDLGTLQPAINQMEQLIRNMHKQVRITNERYVARAVPENTEAGPSYHHSSDDDFEDVAEIRRLRGTLQLGADAIPRRGKNTRRYLGGG